MTKSASLPPAAAVTATVDPVGRGLLARVTLAATREGGRRCHAPPARHGVVLAVIVGYTAEESKSATRKRKQRKTRRFASL